MTGGGGGGGVEFHGLNFKTECSSFSFKLLPKTGSNCCSQ
jgi:hypothetical protein